MGVIHVTESSKINENDWQLERKKDSFSEARKLEDFS